MAQERLDDALFNLDVLIPDANQMKLLGEVTSLDIFESNTEIFHKDGLFSTEIFGNVATVDRIRRMGYIDLKLPILHPYGYKKMIGLNSEYLDIITSKVKVSYNPDIGTFEYDTNGSTGFDYFLKYLPYLNHDLKIKDGKEVPSGKTKRRDMEKQLVQRICQPEYMLKHWLVIPAGLRDYFVNAQGKATQDEINGLYRKLISTVNMIRNLNIKEQDYYIYDQTRLKIQLITVEIFDYIFNLLSDKGGFVQGKWASRAIANGTRNVITANPTTVTSLNSKNKITFNHTKVGLYQYLNATAPLAMHHIHSKFILGCLNPFSNQATVIDPKTLDTGVVTVSTKEKDQWLTRDGLNEIFSKFKQDAIKNDYAMIGNHGYVAMVEDKGKELTVIKDTRNMPPGVDKSKLRPLTYGELLYIAVAETTSKVKAVVTRYPVTGLGSIYPSRCYLVSTTRTRDVKVHMDGKTYELPEYPIFGEKYYQSLSPSSVMLQGLGADFSKDLIY